MSRCLQLAQRGLGTTAPNPMVGAVIVHRGKIIGEAWHERPGEPHAEIKALSAVRDKSLLSASTLYVNLEPCTHHGRTPPCADSIIRCGIPRVVIAMRDPFAQVNGKGIQKLSAAGIEVKTGVLEAEALEQNKRFVTFHQNKRPYIILKWAQTRDGFIDKIRDATAVGQNPISNAYARQLTHCWRAEEQAVLVGTTTLRYDNPKLTTRHWTGDNPLRVSLDRNLEIPRRAAIFSEEAHTLIFTERAGGFKSENVTFVQTKFDRELIKTISDTLYERGIQSVIVEGGGFTLCEFISKNHWDEAQVFTGDKRFKDGLSAPLIRGDLIETRYIQSDMLHIYKAVKQNAMPSTAP